MVWWEQLVTITAHGFRKLSTVFGVFTIGVPLMWENANIFRATHSEPRKVNIDSKQNMEFIRSAMEPELSKIKCSIEAITTLNEKIHKLKEEMGKGI